MNTDLELPLHQTDHVVYNVADTNYDLFWSRKNLFWYQLQPRVVLFTTNQRRLTEGWGEFKETDREDIGVGVLSRAPRRLSPVVTMTHLHRLSRGWAGEAREGVSCRQCRGSCHLLQEGRVPFCRLPCSSPVSVISNLTLLKSFLTCLKLHLVSPTLLLPPLTSTGSFDPYTKTCHVGHLH